MNTSVLVCPSARLSVRLPQGSGKQRRDSPETSLLMPKISAKFDRRHGQRIQMW